MNFIHTTEPVGMWTRHTVGVKFAAFGGRIPRYLVVTWCWC